MLDLLAASPELLGEREMAFEHRIKRGRMDSADAIERGCPCVGIVQIEVDDFRARRVMSVFAGLNEQA